MAAIIFPPHPNDGDQVIDVNGQVYEYDAQSNSWTLVGSDSDSSLVNQTANGIIAPGTVDELNDLQTFLDNNHAYGLKIFPNLNAYWYYFQSRFNYLDFAVRDNIINLGINSSKLLRALNTRACPGTKGLVGAKGLDGEDALIPGPPEGIYQPIQGSDPSILGVEVEVPTPLDTPISLRFFENSNQLVEITLSSDGSIIVGDNTINVAVISLEYNPTSEILRGEISATWPDYVNYKARQVGPTGLAGADGENFMAIRDHYIDDPNAFADSAITTMRANSQSGVLFARADLSLNTSVASLRSASGETFATTPIIMATLDAPIPDRWASVEPTVNEHKTLLNWGFSGCVDSATGQPVLCDVPTLDFPAWNPQAVCYHVISEGNSATTYDYTSFEWWGEDGPPFDLVLTEEPPAVCCQEDCFYCTEDVSNCEGSAPRPLIVDNL